MGTTAEPLNATARTGRGRLAAFVCAALGALAAGAGGLTLGADPAEALPAFARQTGHACADRHTPIPELRPFGRRFKIGGYTLTGGDWQGPPSAFYQIGGTRQTAPYDYTAQGLAAAQQNGLANPQANAAPAELHTNANLTSQQVSVFVAGKLYENLGAFIRRRSRPDLRRSRRPSTQSDVRYADTATWFGKDTIWGIDVNNSADGRGSVEHRCRRGAIRRSIRRSVGIHDLSAAVDQDRGRLPNERRRRRRLHLLELDCMPRCSPIRETTCARLLTA